MNRMTLSRWFGQLSKVQCESESNQYESVIFFFAIPLPIEQSSPGLSWYESALSLVMSIWDVERA